MAKKTSARAASAAPAVSAAARSPVTNQELDALIAAELPSLVAIRHDLHAHPQTAFEETYASGVVQRELKKLGLPFKAGLAKTGVVATIRGLKAGTGRQAIALRADMDALPIAEESGLPYASTNPGKMHACGHDGHTAILLGAARVLTKLRGQLPRPVKLVFQPAEETGGGAGKLVQAGVLTDRIGGVPVAAMFGLHGHPGVPLGTLITRPGPIMAETSVLEIVVRGTGGHAAFPHVGTDAIVAAAAVVSALQTIVSRNVNPTTAAVVSVGYFHAGFTHNVTPESAKLWGTIRTFDRITRDLIWRRVREIATQVAAAHGCQAQLTINPGYPVNINDARATEFTFAVAREAFGAEHAQTMPEPLMGGEDFAYYSQKVPTCFAFLGLIQPGHKDHPALHTPRFNFPDPAIAPGVKMMCRWALAADRMV